jgi:hypothetical protein
MNAINKALSEYFYNDINNIIMDYMDIYNVVQNKGYMLCSAMIVAGMFELPKKQRNLRKTVLFVNRLEAEDDTIYYSDYVDYSY